ncbi:hypothetical protein GCM10027614_63300 [Micromonospora vulcania]
MIPAPRDTGAAGPADPAEGVARDPATEWALTARDGDPAAQAAFVRLTQVEVWRFAAALVDPDSADDLTQETYLRAFRALPAFEVGPAPVPGCSASPDGPAPTTCAR